MSILLHVDATPAERTEYVKQANAIRRAVNGSEEVESVDLEPEEDAGEANLTSERYAKLGAYEQFILTLSENGYGKRTSAYEYRTSGRGGKGIIAMVVNERNGKLVASFPAEDSDQIMLVTDGGKLIRTRVEQISIVGRSTQGVTVFDTADGERVVSVEHIQDDGEGDEEEENDGEDGQQATEPPDAPKDAPGDAD